MQWHAARRLASSQDIIGKRGSKPVRYALSATLIVLGLVLGALGLLQKTIWAPSETISASAELSEPGPVVIVEPGVLNLYDTPAELTVTGEGTEVIAQTSLENAEAWAEGAAQTRITGLASETELATTSTEGEPETPALDGADLWNAQEVGEGTATMKWDSDPGRTAFVIGADGQSPAAQSVTITWPSSAGTPWAIPLIIAGGILLLIGLLLLVTAFNQSSRKKKRDAERRERRRKLAQTGTALMVVGTLALAGCGGETELPQASPAPAPSSPGPVVSPQQAERILGEISTSVAAADQGTDAKALSDRAAGPALDMRKGAYRIKKKDKSFELPAPVATDEVLVHHTTASNSWPRVTTLVTRSGESTQLLNLIQQGPREQYKLYSQSVLLPEVTIPETADPDKGAELLPANAEGLVASPEDVVANYADILEKGDDSKNKDKFAEDAFSKAVIKSQSDQRTKLRAAKGSASFTTTPKKGDLVATRTEDGGAIVTGYLTTKATISPEKTSAGSGALTVPKPQSKVIGDTKISSPLETTYGEAVTFLVPAEGKVTVLGFSQAMTGAKTAN